MRGREAGGGEEEAEAEGVISDQPPEVEHVLAPGVNILLENHQKSGVLSRHTRKVLCMYKYVMWNIVILKPERYSI